MKTAEQNKEFGVPERTLIVEKDPRLAKQYAETLHGAEASTRCVFATTDLEGGKALVTDRSITKVCFHGCLHDSRDAAIAAIGNALKREAQGK